MLLPDATVYLVDKSFRNLETEPKEWIVTDLVNAPAADVREVQYKTGDDAETAYALARSEKGKDPAFETRPEGYGDREIKKSEINTLFGALSGFQIEDVADPENPPADDAFDQVFEYRLFDGAWYAVSLGGAAPESEDQYYVKVRAGYTAPEEEEATTESEGDDASVETDTDDPEAQKKAEEDKKKAAEERLRKQAELKEKALKLDEKLRSWTYIVPEWRYNKFKSDVEALFEEPPAAEEGTEAEAASQD
jgi:hypothetical protein